VPIFSLREYNVSKWILQNSLRDFQKSSDMIFGIMSTNVVTQLVLEVIMTHFNLEGSRRYLVRG